MLLIPDLQDKNKSSSADSSIDNSLFRIFPDKTVLNTRISLDSLGMQSVSSDSINTIYYFGNVKKIDFDFQVENKALNQSIRINPESIIWNFFRFREAPDLRAVLFSWKPPILDNKNYVYNVIVTAKADIEVFDKAKKKNILRKFNSTTQFSLVVNYYDNQTGLLISSLKIVCDDYTPNLLQQHKYGENIYGIWNLNELIICQRTNGLIRLLFGE